MLVCLALELSLAGRRQSQTFDEADHILAGYRYWKCADFAANPEHPPMVKLVASFPLLFQKVRTPSPLCDYAQPSTHNDFVGGRIFLYSNDADSILFQTRLFASIFTIVLGFLLFESGYVMFGAGPGLIALTIFIFEPNLLAHGFLVTTDMGVACCLYAAVFVFYRYLEGGARYTLVLTGILAGATLAAKHSGILLFPILAAVALVDLANGKTEPRAGKHFSWGRRLLSLIQVLALIALIAYVVLWAFYGFRFSARPTGELLAYPEHEFARGFMLKSLVAIFTKLLQLHFLPESYLYGIRHVFVSLREGGPIFVLGKMYPTGRWFYFPIVFLVKSTLGFLLLLLLGITALFFARDKNKRALSILSIPPLLFLAFCLPSKLDLGIRHILPMYPFLIVLASAGVWELRKRRVAIYAVAALIALHAASSMASFPNYIPYSNEAFGGTRNTYRILGESNVDWGQSVKAVQNYIRTNQVKDCWISYLTSGDPSYYRMGCKFLPTTYGWVSRDDMSQPEVEGTLLIAANELERPVELDPYAQFQKIVPAASISGTVLVFHGRFDLPRAFALSQMNRSETLSDKGRGSDAIDAARRAVGAAPDTFLSHAELARALALARRIEEARTEYQTAIILARKICPEYNEQYVEVFEKELQQLH